MKFLVFLGVFFVCNIFPTVVQAEVQPHSNTDPLESINRPVFAFNDGLDRLLFRPLATGYDAVLPEFVKRGIGNVFRNTSDLTTAVNSILQGDIQNAGLSSGRFLLNSTLGLIGIFDVATEIGVTAAKSDFGHTLAVWGAPRGPYLMVPLLGPRTFRSGTGSIFDAFSSVERQIDNVALRNSVLGLELVDARAQLLKADDLISGDRYVFVRNAYLQRRDSLINDGKIIDDFQYELEEEF